MGREDDPVIAPVGETAELPAAPDESGAQPWQIALPEFRFKYAPEYAGLPDTAVSAFYEVWKSAGDDTAKQLVAFLKTLLWMMLEMREAARWGRNFLLILPADCREAIDDGAEILHPYKQFHEIYLARIREWLPRCVNMAYRGYGKFGMTADAIIDLARRICSRGDMLVSQIGHVADELDGAAKVLDDFLRRSIPLEPERSLTAEDCTSKGQGTAIDRGDGENGDAGETNAARIAPLWDKQSRELKFASVLCLSYAREAPNQFTILDAFQSSDWPDTIAPSLQSEQLTQTLRDMRKRLQKVSPIGFRLEKGRVRWVLLTGESISR
jgi:hypothetical protein